MATVTYNLLPTEALVVEPAPPASLLHVESPKWARMEFSAAEIQKAVEVGANPAITKRENRSGKSKFKD